MKYNACSSCIFFRPEIKDATQITRKHCACPQVKELFGVKTGFPSGIDITRCDFHKFPSFDVDDIVYQFPGGYRIGFVVPSARPKSRLGAGDLFDNSKNQKIHKIHY